MRRARCSVQKYWGEIITGVMCIGLSCFFGFLALDFPAGGGTLPIFTAVATIFLSLLMIGNALFKRGPELMKKMKIDWSYQEKKPFLIFILALLHAWSIFVVGYFSSAVLFLVAGTLLVGLRDYRAILKTAVILFPLMYAFFVLFLRAQLPRGFLF